MYVSSGNKHLFTKSCHRQTYQNYEEPPQTSQNSYFQSRWPLLYSINTNVVSKLGRQMNIIYS